MATIEQRRSDPLVQPSLSLLQELLQDYHPRDVTFRFWDGSEWEAETAPRCVLHLKHAGSLRRMLWPPRRISLAEAYLYDDFDIDGDIEAVWEMVLHLYGLRSKLRLPGKLRLGARLYRLPRDQKVREERAPEMSGKVHSLERDRKAVTYHYNVSNDFYALWLDRQMVYTCAYFRTPEDTIDQAQEQKLDYVCRKLRLQPGERLLDIGCGWGALSLHAARHYGVRTYGFTLSQPQVDWAVDRARREGLADRCTFEVKDYRQIAEAESFDKIAAIGIMEHVGESMFPTYFAEAWRLLKPGGVFLSHGIALAGTDKMPRKPNFAQKYVFPDGELIPIHRNLTYAEKQGWEVRDVESLRDHYRLTTWHWLKRLEAQADKVRQLTGDFIYRIYRWYLSGSTFGFRINKINLYQALLLKPHADGRSGLPLTRHDWYT